MRLTPRHNNSFQQWSFSNENHIYIYIAQICSFFLWRNIPRACQLNVELGTLEWFLVHVLSAKWQDLARDWNLTWNNPAPVWISIRGAYNAVLQCDYLEILTWDVIPPGTTGSLGVLGCHGGLIVILIKTTWGSQLESQGRRVGGETS